MQQYKVLALSARNGTLNVNDLKVNVRQRLGWMALQGGLMRAIRFVRQQATSEENHNFDQDNDFASRPHLKSIIILTQDNDA